MADQPDPRFLAIASRVDALAEQLPQLIADYPDEGDFWAAFAGVADSIEDDAGEISDDIWEYVNFRIESMLIDAGLQDPATRQT